MFNNDYYFIALFRHKSLKPLKFLNTIFFIFSHKDNLMNYSHGYFMDSTYIKHYLDGINLLEYALKLTG
ncbi:hypothetical protein JP0173_07300 [Helicobacter pylori]|nr:hypothetical protein JSHR3_10090 [Helicobacter pylori]GHQ36442.1 hypothetical protein JP0065_09890 [Helicobacter pylori]GHQ96524.1 hypothetical protein JP0086_12560 [Helicobacter pylori]